MNDKQLALETIGRLPDDASIEEISPRLEFIAAVQKGLAEIKKGEVVPHEEVKRQLAAWLSK